MCPYTYRNMNKLGVNTNGNKDWPSSDTTKEPLGTHRSFTVIAYESMADNYFQKWLKELHHQCLLDMSYSLLKLQTWRHCTNCTHFNTFALSFFPGNSTGLSLFSVDCLVCQCLTAALSACVWLGKSRSCVSCLCQELAAAFDLHNCWT